MFGHLECSLGWRLIHLHMKSVYNAWSKIQAEVNKAGANKTIKQWKDKLRNLKDAYKTACDTNKQSGAAAIMPPNTPHLNTENAPLLT